MNNNFEEWAKEYKRDKRKKAIREFFGKCIAYSIVFLFFVAVAVWIVVYAIYLSPITRYFFFDFLGLYAFPGFYHVFPLFGIPILVVISMLKLFKAIRNIKKTRIDLEHF
jgi:amino acid transporter